MAISSSLSIMLKGFPITIGILLIIGSTNASAVGAEKCTWGPAYWCSGLKESSKCSATTHCINNVWNDNPYPADGDDICKICKEMVKEARDQLLSNETQEELKEVFEGSCALIPLKIIADECKTLADEFIPELIETLASEMNPDTVCTVAGLCNSARIDSLMATYLRSRTNCDVCHEGVKKVHRRFKAMDKNDVLDKGLAMCGRYMGSYSDACKLSLLENFEDLYDTLLDLDDGICEATPLCSQESKRTPALLTSGDSLECQFCTKVLQHYIDIWSTNQTEEEFKQVLDTICRTLGQPDRINRCLHIVDDYYIPFYNYLIHDVNAKAACTAVGLCGSEGFLQVNPDVPVSILLPFDYPKNVMSTPRNQVLGGYFAPQVEVQMNTPGCVICEFVMHRLREWLQDGHTQDEIQEGLEEICSVMPEGIKSQCTNLVDTEGPAIIQLIIRGIEITEICKVLRLCDGSQNNLLGDSLTSYNDDINVGSLNPVVVMKQKNEACATCNYVVNIVLEQVRDKDNEDEVRNAIQSVCRILPSSVDARCELLVGEYAEKIIELIAQNLTPAEICQALYLCPDPKPKGEGCMLCQFVITQLDKIVEDKQNEEEIERALKTLCSYLPSKYEAKCDAFVDTYTALIIDLMAKDLSPDEICDELGLCNDEIFELIQEKLDVMGEESLDGDDVGGNTQTCMFCKFAFGELDKLIADKHNEEQIKEGMEKLCSYLPAYLANQCKNFVDNYTETIIDMLVQDATPEEMCQEIGLCEKKRVVEVSYGGNTQTCMFCKFAIGELDKLIENKQDVEEIKAGLDKLCSYLPKNYADQCKTLVDTYTDIIIDMIVKEATPEEICQEIGLCDKTLYILPPVEMDLEGSTCEICEFAMTKLDEILEDKNNQEEIKEALDSLCSYLPDSIKDECKTYVDTYTEMIIEMLTNDVTPKEICTELGLCTTDVEELEPSIVEDTFDVYSSDEYEDDEDRPYCMMCEYVVGEIDKYVTDNRTEENIRETVEQICHLLSTPIRNECKLMVDRYTKQLIEMFISEYTPAQICAELGLCDKGLNQFIDDDNDILSNDIPSLTFDEDNSLESSEESSEELLQTPILNIRRMETPSCALCEFAMNVLEKQILSNRTLDMVERAVLMLCSYMPETIADKCEDYVQTYGDEIIKLIVEMEMSPDEVCAELGLCPSDESTSPAMFDASSVGGRRCIWGREFWCQSLVHAKACGTVDYCIRTNGWYRSDIRANNIVF